MTEDLLQTPSSPKSAGNRRAWLLLPCLLVGLAGALVAFVSLTVQVAPFWLALASAALIFPVLPALWHVWAERARQRPVTGSRGARFALRTLAIGLLVLSVSSATLGPRGLVRLVAGRLGYRETAAPAKVADSAATNARNELYPFVPADANLVIALSDPAALKHILAAQEPESQNRIAALEKCQIQVDHALVLIAGRDKNTHMVVVRAPGVTDQRNLYCLVGVLGNDKLKLRFTGEKEQVRFELDGLFATPMKFEVVDPQTIVAVDDAWRATAGQKLTALKSGMESPLAAALERVDGRAGLWSAVAVKTDKGWWDLALDVRFSGSGLDLRASSTPPSGPDHRSQMEMRMPAEFVSALPQAALENGLQGLFAVLAAASAGVPPSGKVPPAPAR